jgi:hypothetical protein
MSVFLMSVIGALAYIGVFDFNNFLTMPNSVKIIAFIVVFLILFLFVFCLLNLKRSSSRKKKTAAMADAAAAAAVPAGVTRHQGGLLATASRLSPSGVAVIDETSGGDVIYEENGVPYINSDLARKNNQGPLNNNFVKLVESVTGSVY